MLPWTKIKLNHLKITSCDLNCNIHVHVVYLVNIGGYYLLICIIITFQLLSLQHWLYFLPGILTDKNLKTCNNLLYIIFCLIWKLIQYLQHISLHLLVGIKSLVDMQYFGWYTKYLSNSVFRVPTLFLG
jgi:hypothetical protein